MSDISFIDFLADLDDEETGDVSGGIDFLLSGPSPNKIEPPKKSSDKNVLASTDCQESLEELGKTVFGNFGEINLYEKPKKYRESSDKSFYDYLDSSDDVDLGENDYYSDLDTPRYYSDRRERPFPGSAGGDVVGSIRESSSYCRATGKQVEVSEATEARREARSQVSSGKVIGNFRNKSKQKVSSFVPSKKETISVGLSKRKLDF